MLMLLAGRWRKDTHKNCWRPWVDPVGEMQDIVVIQLKYHFTEGISLEGVAAQDTRLQMVFTLSIL